MFYDEAYIPYIKLIHPIYKSTFKLYNNFRTYLKKKKDQYVTDI